MPLLGNRSVLHKSPVRFINGREGLLRSNFNKHGMIRNTYEQFDDRSAQPTGHLSGSAWVLAKTAGGLSSRNVIVGTGALAGSGAEGINAAAPLSGAGDITFAEMQLVVSAIAALSGSGAINTPELLGKLEAAAALAGSGNIAGAIGALAGLVAALVGSGSVSSATPYASGTMSANIRGYSDLTPEGLRDSVWNALSASYDSAGTMGEKLNDAGSAGNPWATVIESGYTAGEIMQILAAFAAGKTDIVDLGGGNATVTFRDLGDTKDRIMGDMTGSERTTVTVDTDP